MGGCRCPAAPARPSDRGPTAAPPSLAAAKRELIEARAEVARVRTELKRDRRWVKREDLEFRLNDAATRARQALWAAFPGRMVRFAGGHADIAAITREVQSAAVEALAFSRERAPAPIARPASSVDES